jgi:hypothetical protein
MCYRKARAISPLVPPRQCAADTVSAVAKLACQGPVVTAGWMRCNRRALRSARPSPRLWRPAKRSKATQQRERAASRAARRWVGTAAIGAVARRACVASERCPSVVNWC